MNKLLLLATTLLLFTACSQSKLYYKKSERDWMANKSPEKSDEIYSLFLIGDVGDDTTYSGPVLHSMADEMNKHNPNSSGVIFLGDNIYPEGMHKKSSKKRAEDELRINIQLDVVKDYEGDVIFIPGNHDWDRQGEGGWKHVKRQEDYIQEYLDRGNVFLPSHGCPGPEVVKLAPGLVMIIFDSQWWVHQFERPSGEKDGCDVRTMDELMALFKDLLKKYRDQNVIVATHHPLYSNGHHGGKFSLKDHIFPLTEASEKAYVPLPIIGSIYPAYRKFLGHPQDIPHPVYRDMKNKLEAAMNEYENVIYIAGHEHNLQYTHQDNIHHVVSGSGSKVTYLRKSNKINFGAEERGYAKIVYYNDGSVWLDFYTVDIDNDKEEKAFSKQLFQRDVITNANSFTPEKTSYANQFAIVTPDSTYEANGMKRLIFGDLNRELWTTSLKVPYLDIHNVAGGLTPIKKGGGFQTLSLRMQGGDGYQYTLRGIKKSSTYLIDKNLRGTLAQDLIYDGIAASHPYASVAIPKLSDAAGVYHSNPTLVYLPKDKVLGDYANEFGGMFCLFEERPDGDMSAFEHFGNSKKVMNYNDAIHKMHSHYDHIPDTRYILNARLFDMVIGDWDRHDDQWRWGKFKEGDFTYYRPIPRDRDQAFFQFDGLLMSLVNRKWTVRKFQTFDDKVRDMAGLNFNARYFDRSFLIEANREEWIEVAKNLQASLTDKAIEDALRDLPQEGFNVTGEEIIQTLKTRRDKLTEFAEEYYEILAKEVSIPGTLDDDYFEVIRHEDGSVEVNLYPRSKKGKKKEDERYFHRIFKKDETKEIRLYGLEGNDEYKIKGETNKSIVVRIIGGYYKDKIEDKSKVSGLKKYTKVYETDGKNDFDIGKETSIKQMNEINAYDYDRKDFIYNKLAPSASIGFNANDGFYIGPGFTYITYGFKKFPYRSKHKLAGHYAFGTQGFHIDYQFEYIDAIGKADIGGELRIDNPLFYPFFGAGNELPEIEEDIDYHVQVNDYQFLPKVTFNSKTKSQILSLKGKLQRITFKENPIAEVQAWEVQEQQLAGIGLQYTYSNKDNEVYPSRGVAFITGGEWNASFNNDRINYQKVHAELRLYLPINFINRQTTLNLRSGVETNFGDYAFHQATFLSGLTNFRGIERNQFSGRTAAFNTAEVRLSLLKVPNYVAPFDFGLIGHTDLARVWEDGENSKVWHHSYGGGVFVNIANSFMLVGTYTKSDIDRLVQIGSNFFF